MSAHIHLGLGGQETVTAGSPLTWGLFTVLLGLMLTVMHLVTSLRSQLHEPVLLDS